MRRKYGRAIHGPQAITRPVGGGMYEVIEVDSKGTRLHTIAKRVPDSLAKTIIKRRG